NANKKKYGFESTTSTEKSNDSDNTNSKFENYIQLIETLKNKISILNNKIQKQESCHKMTIEFYRKELQERSKLLKNQQILTLESNKKIQKLEYKLEEEK
ncbi:MAG: Partitioning protein, partial [Escherichia coli DORA_B_14]